MMDWTREKPTTQGRYLYRWGDEATNNVYHVQVLVVLGDDVYTEPARMGDWFSVTLKNNEMDRWLGPLDEGKDGA